ncbi:MAG: helix-turn-helix transcriptional regulator [Cyanobacteria bacterium SBLK]|nr:helix-turn-helix transcriptional regulator [Cyanobacteria bacterium SBLK]
MEVERTRRVKPEGLGQRIKQARQNDLRTMKELCERANLTPTHWYDIEKENVKILPEETLRRIEAVLGIDFGVNFDDD